MIGWIALILSLVTLIVAVAQWWRQEQERRGRWR